MEKFELCFPLASEKGIANTFIIPELMAADPPDEWEMETPDIDECEQMLLFEYHYNFMPAGIITRFIVRQHFNIHKNLFWKHGVLLKYGESFATVQANSFKRIITIHIYGSKKDTGDVLSLIRNEIEYIHKTLNYPEVKEQIPCNCDGCRSSTDPWFFDFAVLRMFQDRGKKTIACNKTAKDVDIIKLVRGYRRRDFPSLYLKQECTVFLSHSSQDKSKVRQIYEGINEAGIKAWLDEKEIFPGDSIVDSITRGLEKTNVLILIFSRNSIEAPWVKTEMNAAIYRKNKQNDIRIIPVLLENVTLPLLLQDTAYVDMSNDFEQGIKKLIDTIKS